MKKFILLTLLVIGAYTQEIANNTVSDTNTTNSDHDKMKEKFDRFCRKWKKSYSSPEEQAKRFHIFKHNYKMSEEMNKGSQISVYGITKFFDMETQDFHKMYLNLEVNFVDMMRAEAEFEDFSDDVMENTSADRPQNTTQEEGLRHLSTDYNYTHEDDYESHDPKDDPNWDLPEPFGIKNITVLPTEDQKTFKNLRVNTPDSWDWRSRGAVTYVRNQGVCGACWAFTTVANIEGLHYNKNKELKVLSEQELLDCNTQNSGCYGGTLPVAFTYVKNAKGISLRSKYPYTGTKTTCNPDPEEKYGHIKGYVSPGMDENSIKNMLYSKGPLSAAINAGPLYFYRGGVLDPSVSTCNPYAVNHGVTLVGYGTQDGVDYWIIKNSWGPNWGEKGYFRIRRGSGACGINRMVYSGVLKN